MRKLLPLGATVAASLAFGTAAQAKALHMTFTQAKRAIPQWLMPAGGHAHNCVRLSPNTIRCALSEKGFGLDGATTASPDWSGTFYGIHATRISQHRIRVWSRDWGPNVIVRG